MLHMTRKQFLALAARGALATLALPVLVDCGGGGDSGPDPDAPDAGPPDCLANGTHSVIQRNHGHVLVVSKSDVAAGVMKTYDITGSATHSHSVTITAGQFGTLQANSPISTVSTVGDGHTHQVAVTCA